MIFFLLADLWFDCHKDKLIYRAKPGAFSYSPTIKFQLK